MLLHWNTMNKPHILYLSPMIPEQGLGGNIIFYRHLKKLEESNWRISLCVSQNLLSDKSYSASWKILPLPYRKWWWPPAKHKIPFSTELRIYQWSFILNKSFRKDKPSVILTQFGDTYSYLAAFLAKKWRIPLAVIIHDNCEVQSSESSNDKSIKKYRNKVLQQANVIWPVSQKLGNTLDAKYKSKVSVLLPIPNDSNNNNFVEWNDNFKTNPTICYAGKIYPQLEITLEKISKTLKKINGKLILISNNTNSVKKLVKDNSNIYLQPFFKYNQDAVKFVTTNCSCFLVAYPLYNFQDDVYLKFLFNGSFPSKFVEFAHTGLPILILTPPNTALFDWTQKKCWKNIISIPDEQILLEKVKKITDKNSWLEMAQQTRYIASTEFNPLNIHNQLQNKLLSLIKNNLEN